MDPVCIEYVKSCGDEWCHQLQRHLLAKGKGRPPLLPASDQNPTYLQLLQIHNMKKETKVSWNQISRAMEKMFGFSQRRFRAVIESAVTKMEKLEFEDMKVQLMSTVDLRYVGPRCAALGIDREKLLNITLLNEMIFPDSALIRGVVYELEKFQSLEKLDNGIFVQWLSKIANLNILFEVKSVMEKVGEVKLEFQVMNKSRSKKMTEIETYLGGKFPIAECNSDGVVEVGCDSADGEHVSTSSVVVEEDSSAESSTSSNVNHNVSTAGENLKLTRKVKKLEASVSQLLDNQENLTMEIEVLKELCCDKDNERKKMEVEVSAKAGAIGELQEKVNDLMTNKKAVETNLSVKSSDLAKLKKSARYERLKQLEKDLLVQESIVTSLKEHVEKHTCQKQIQELKQKLKEAQTKLSNALSDLKKCRDHRRCFELENISLKSECRHLGAEVLSWQNKEFDTKIEGKFTDNIRQCVMLLVGEGEVPVTRCSDIMKIVSRCLFGVILSEKQLPSRTTIQNIADEAHVLAKYHVAEEMLESNHYDLHQDGTTRDRRKYMGTQVTLDSGKTLSAGFTSIATEDSRTLLDLAIDILHELCDIFDEDKLDQNFHDMLKKLTSVMSDRCSVMKSFKENFNEYRKTELGIENDIEYIYCNAHFLLGLCTNSEKILAETEKDLGTLGRDLLPCFRTWGGSECCTSRFIRTASDCFGPRGDEKSGCREYWLAYCAEKGIQSRITSYRSNRFNNFYASAAALYHHRAHIIDFLETNYENAHLNLKLKSVLADAKSEEIMCLTRIIGILYYTITSPYWTLLHSSTEYVDFHKYVQEMHGHFSKLAVDPSPLMIEDVQLQSVFADFPIQQDEVLHSLCFNQVYPDYATKALKNLILGFKAVTEKQLTDFLPNGRYGSQVDDDTRQRMKHSKLTNLIGEFVFGDLDFSLFKRRHASLHHHSTINMIKRNKTISSWLCMKDTPTQKDLMTLDRKKSTRLRTKHKEDIQKVQDQVKAILKKKQAEKEAKIANKIKQKKDIMEEVKKNGGPCCSVEDVNNLLDKQPTKGKKLAALKAEIRFLKEIVCIEPKDPLLKLGEKLDTMEKNIKTVITRYFTGNITQVEELPEGDQPTVSGAESDFDDASLSDSTSNSSKSDAESADSSSMEGGSSQTQQMGDHGELPMNKYTFNRQGDWVCVYYDEGIFFGQVLDVQSPEEGTVKFLQQCNMDKKIFKWPDIDEVDVVKSIHIVEGGFDVNIKITRRGQLCQITVDNIDKFIEKYRKYRKCAFLSLP